MKKKSASRSAFFNLRVLIGLFVVLAGVFLALAGPGTFSVIASSSTRAQQKKPKIINIPGLPPGFDCATIHEKGIDRDGELSGRTHHDCLRRGQRVVQLHLAMPWSGLSKNCCQSRWRMAPGMLTWSRAPRPLRTLFSRRHTLRPTRTTPTRSSSPTTTPEARPTINFSGASVSTDGGVTFTRLTKAAVKALCQYLWRPGYSV